MGDPAVFSPLLKPASGGGGSRGCDDRNAIPFRNVGDDLSPGFGVGKRSEPVVSHSLWPLGESGW